MKYLVIVLVVCAPAGALAQAHKSKQLKSIDDQIHRAVVDINSIMATPDKAIPRDLLNKALCVGIIPSEVKVAFLVGGSYGRGLLVCRKNGTGDWGGPAMFTLGGGSFGFQLGASATDVVFLVMNPAGARKLASSDVKLGADASAAAGPVGRTAGAATNAQMDAEILTYSRSHGLFAGVSLTGSLIKQDEGDDETLYGHKASSADILIRQRVAVPRVARELDRTLDKYSPHGGKSLSM